MIGGKFVLEDVEVEWTLDQGTAEIAPVEPMVRFTVTQDTGKSLPLGNGINVIYRESATVVAPDFYKAMFLAMNSDPDNAVGTSLGQQELWDAVERVKKATTLRWLP
jgi:hypothetical protein